MFVVEVNSAAGWQAFGSFQKVSEADSLVSTLAPQFRDGVRVTRNGITLYIVRR